MDGLQIAIVPDTRCARCKVVACEGSNLTALIKRLDYFLRWLESTARADKVIERMRNHGHAALATRTSNVLTVPIFHFHFHLLLSTSAVESGCPLEENEALAS